LKDNGDMRRPSSAAVLFLALLAAGCGYVMAGTWVDDPGNWSRAFHSTKPPDVTVVHSKYSRSPHFTFEFEYFFEIAPNTKLKEQLFSENKLRRLAGVEATKAKANVFGAVPAWFAPKAAGEYDTWVLEGEPNRNFKVLIDRTSGVMFLSDYQV
jgi:hypothetical protein